MILTRVNTGQGPVGKPRASGDDPMREAQTPTAVE